MPLDPVLVSLKLRFNDKRMIAHLPKLDQHDGKDGSRHVHRQRRNRRQQRKLCQIEQRVQVRACKNIPDFHQRGLVHEIQRLRLAVRFSQNHVHQIKRAFLRQQEKDVARRRAVNTKEDACNHHIRPTHEIFAPTQKEIQQAERVVRAIRENADKGVGIFLLDGKMLDVAFVEGAERTIALAKASGVYKGEL